MSKYLSENYNFRCAKYSELESLEFKYTHVRHSKTQSKYQRFLKDMLHAILRM